MSNDWLSYKNPQYGFALTYPSSHVILKEDQPFSSISEGLLFRVRFLDKKLSTSETAQLQVPNISVEVFKRPNAMELGQWLDQSAPAGNRTPITQGGFRGIKLVSPLLMAPNEFFYFDAGANIFRLILLTPASQRILESFQSI